MPISDEELQILIEKIALDHSWDLSMYKPDTLKRRILSRIHDTGCETPEKYYELIDGSEEEYSNLIGFLTVNYTYWFRDEHAWNEIMRVMDKKALEGNGTIRIWSAGCSTGEEPYSLAILALKIKALRETPEHPVNFVIHATDISQMALDAAKAGIYRRERVNLNMEEIAKYFDDFEGGYAIKPEIKKLVSFEKLDLTKDQYPRFQDIILCRNVMIYFTKDLQKSVIENFYYSLKDDGHFINGKSEVLPQSTQNLWEILNLEEHIFQKV